MKHIEEHILEKYIVSPDDVLPLKLEIEQHLTECHGCKETVERIRLFYSNLDARLEYLTEDSLISTQALTRIEQRISTNIGSDLQAFEELPITFWGKIVYSAKKHPIATGSSAVVLLCFSALLLMTLLPAKKDLNPDNFISDNNIITVVNKKLEPLWKLSSPNLKNTLISGGNFYKQLIVKDLDNDGINEVITSLQMDNETYQTRKLRVFNADHSLRFEYIPDNDLTFRGRIYREGFFGKNIEIVSDENTGNKLIAFSSSNGHSPSIISFLNSQGVLQGEYVHFGNLTSLVVDSLRNGRQVLIADGHSDIEEFNHKKYISDAILIVLDPWDQKQKNESRFTKGFGLDTTNVELAYIRFPRTDIDIALEQYRTHSLIQNVSRNSIVVLVITEKDNIQSDFTYTFNKQLQIIDVKANDGAYKTFENLKKTGKLTGTIDSTYLQNLKSRLEYWDGRVWKTQLPAIKHF